MWYVYVVRDLFIYLGFLTQTVYRTSAWICSYNKSISTKWLSRKKNANDDFEKLYDDYGSFQECQGNLKSLKKEEKEESVQW